MERKSMKKNKTSLIGFVLGMMMLFAGVQGVFAACMGTVKFKAPKDWTQAVFSGQNLQKPATVTAKDADGYFVLDLSTLGLETYVTKFSIANKAASPNVIVTDTVWQHTNAYDANAIQNMATIPCGASADEIIYVAEDVINPGKAYIGSNPPNAKYFYVLMPDEKEWQSDELMIHYTTAAGVAKDTAMMPSSDYCGWFYMTFENAPSDAILYRKNAPDAQLGIFGLWGEEETATPINLSLVFKSVKGNELYFIPDNGAWPDDTHEGWYETPFDVDGSLIEGTCTFNLAAVIYDSDQSLNPVFTSDPDNSGFGACVGVHTGIVMPDLGADNKPVFSGSANAVKCFGNEANFKTLFNYAPGINEMQCYDMPFRHYGKDTRWGFDSDSTHYDKAGNAVPAGTAGSFTGGFYPLESTTDASVVVLNGVPQGPTPTARTKRKAEAPVGFTVPDLDHYCNTPGWFGGVDCEGMFQDGDTPAVWDWGVRETWTGVTRNQQYCFESHATFTYSEDQEFTFRGDDDIWVFINKKIAVDNGGAHLATPGHVVLKNLNTTYGAGFLVPGQDYPLDIFFCDRRTTMTNVIIKTNMYIKQSTGLDLTAPNEANGYKLGICVETSGGNDCAAVALGQVAEGAASTIKCGDEIDAEIAYEIHRRTPDENGNTLVEALAPGQIHHSTINLTNPKNPTIDLNGVTGIAPGSYRLYVIVNGKKEYLNFRIRGNLGVVTEDVTFFNTDNDVSVYRTGTTWKFEDKGVASLRVPVYISAPDGQGGVDLASAKDQTYALTISSGELYESNDPAAEPIFGTYSGKIDETGIDTLWVSMPLSSLTADPTPVTVSVGKTSFTLNFYSPQIGFATQNTDDSTKWTFVTADPDMDADGEEYFHWVGSDVDLYVIAKNPVTGEICKECNFGLTLFAADSGIVGMTYDFEDGVSMVRIRSSVEYGTGNPASITVAALDNNALQTSFGNMHFYKPPVAIPVVVDVFDVYGKPLAGLNLIEPYYNEAQEYLDGKADSIAVRYDRAIRGDSLPSYICLRFDEDHLTTINPFEMGISNNSKDTKLECSAQIGAEAIAAAYAKAEAAAAGDSVRTLGFRADSTFSVKVKTLVNREDKLYSFAEYKWRGKVAKAAFDKGLTDRMAPVITKGIIVPQSEDSDNIIDVMTLTFSEPVNFAETFGTEAFSIYLNSATEISSPDARYRNPTAQKAPNQSKDEISILFRNDEVANPTPHVGDYVRFRADVWSDTVVIDMSETDTLRKDHSTKWNAPTDYNSTGRLPSPWVVLEGAAKIAVTEVSFGTPDVTNPEKIAAPAVEVFGIPTTASKDEVIASYPNTLGHILQSDMGALKLSSDQYKNVDPKDIYFNYEVYYFTNIGNYVASKTGKIQCTDETFFNGDCTKSENRKNFYIAWNMKTEKGRFVGTGAYIVKMNSFVKLGEFGKKAKFEETSVWGVKR